MQYKAIVSFSGKTSMAMGEVKDISDQSLADDLLRAGHIIPFVTEKEEPKMETVEGEKSKPKRKGKKDENNS